MKYSPWLPFGMEQTKSWRRDTDNTLYSPITKEISYRWRIHYRQQFWHDDNFTYHQIFSYFDIYSNNNLYSDQLSTCVDKWLPQEETKKSSK